MIVNDDMIARFFDGKANSNEKKLVRQHLCQNPNELQKAVYYMDNDDKFYMETKQTTSQSVGNDVPTGRITMRDLFVGRTSHADLNSNDDFLSRLNKMCNEI